MRSVLSGVGRHGSDLGDEDFLAIRSRLPAETREFVPRFFAAAILASDPGSFGFPEVETLPIAYDEVMVPDATSMDVIARAAGASEEEIMELNPQYLRGFTPVGSARIVRVPVGRGAAFERAFALIPPEERISFVEHVVARGETFSHVAARYGVPLREIVDTNRNIDPRRLQIGMTLVVKVGRASRGASVTEVAARGGDATHVVREGESLWTIARRYGVTTDALSRANERSGSLIRPGDELRIP
jgi:membrane-bound lytic murein transglycosylase D